jgi:hypothetical protein
MIDIKQIRMNNLLKHQYLSNQLYIESNDTLDIDENDTIPTWMNELNDIDRQKIDTLCDHTLILNIKQVIDILLSLTYSCTHILHKIDSYLYLYIQTQIISEYNNSLGQLSFDDYDCETLIHDSDELMVSGSMIQLIDILIKNIDIHYNCIVTHIEQKEEIYIHTSKDTYICVRIIVTVPISILKNNLITFTPSLPDEVNQKNKYLFFYHVYMSIFIC